MNIGIPLLETTNGEPAQWSLRLFGGFELNVLPAGDRAASLGRRERALLAYLALSPKGRQPRRKLATLIWGEGTDRALQDNLRTCLWRLRKALGDTGHRILASDQEDIVLDTAVFEVDALVFERFASRPKPFGRSTSAKPGGKMVFAPSLPSAVRPQNPTARRARRLQRQHRVEPSALPVAQDVGTRTAQ